MPKTAAKKSSKAGGKAKKDPNAPKRPTSAYIYFSNDQRPKVKSENPDLSFGDIAREISNRWKSADDKTKKKYEDLAAKDKTRYEKETGAGGRSSSKAAATEDAEEDEDDD